MPFAQLPVGVKVEGLFRMRLGFSAVDDDLLLFTSDATGFQVTFFFRRDFTDLDDVPLESLLSFPASADIATDEQVEHLAEKISQLAAAIRRAAGTQSDDAGV